jgi:magnesium transporter
MIHSLLYRDHKFAAENPPVDSLATLIADPGVMIWVDLDAATDDEIRIVMQETFGIHPLTIEDCVQDSPLPKVEEMENYLYLVMHAVDYTRADKFSTTELDLILGRNFLITFHRNPLKPLVAAMERFRKNTATQVRGPDRFAHTLLDLIVENYKPALDELRQEVEVIEEAVLARAKGGLTKEIVETRESLTTLRQTIRPQREIVAQLAVGKTPFFRPKLLPYLRDLSDDLVRIEEQAKGWSEQLIFAFRLHLNRSSHEANAGIRVLTGLTAVTIPLLLIGSWFAMNFREMPLLASRAAYWVTLAVTIASTVVMFVFLKKRKWF